MKTLTDNFDLLFSALRWIKPNLVFKGQALITRHDDAQEILSNNVAFHVPYTEKMFKVTDGGNFFLGMQQTPEYTRDTSNMRLTVRRDDLSTRIIPFIEKTITKLVADKPGSMDFIQDLSRKVPTRLIGDYFGTPGWDENEFTNAASSMFNYLFYPDNPELEKVALAWAKKTREYLDDTITDRAKQRNQRDDVIERCLKLQDVKTPGMTNLDIRNNLIGLIIGAIPTTSKCAALTLDYLLDNPDLLADAQKTAKLGNIEKINMTVLESLRFRPFAPGILRIAVEDYVVAQGNFRRAKISKGTKVIIATQSAQMDWRRFKSPKTFSTDRPEYLYMHYGFGLHRCFGQYINAVQIPRIVQAILLKENLRRAPGDAGKMKVEEPFPINLKIEYSN